MQNPAMATVATAIRLRILAGEDNPHRIRRFALAILPKVLLPPLAYRQSGGSTPMRFAAQVLDAELTYHVAWEQERGTESRE